MNSRVRSSRRRWLSGLLWAVAAVAGLLGGGAGPAEAGWTSIGPYGGEIIVCRPRPRPHDPDHPLRRDGAAGWRRLQDHGRGHELEPGEHGAAAAEHLRLRRRPRPRPHDPDHPLRGDVGQRRLQDHGRGRELEPGEHGAGGFPPGRRPRPRPHDPDHALRRDGGGVVGGVFKTTDGGTSWSPTAPMAAVVLALAPVTPTTLYAGSDGSGVFKTTDGGGSWSPVNTGLPSPLRVAALALDPTTPTTLYAGTWGSGVFKTTDGGATWRPMNTGLTCGSPLATSAPSPSTPRPRPPSTPGQDLTTASSRPRTGARLAPHEHGADVWSFWSFDLRRRRPHPRPHDPAHPLRRDV